MSGNNSADRMRPEVRLVAGTAMFAVLVGAIAGVAVWKHAPESSAQSGPVTSQEGHFVDVSLEQGQVNLVCPPGVVDPVTSTQLGSGAMVWQTPGATDIPLNGGGLGIDVPTELLSAGSYGAVTISGAPQGDLASFLAESCVVPAREVVLPAGATEIGESALLILSNPAAKAVEAEVQVFTSIGLAMEKSVQITIPAESTVYYLPAVWVPAENKIAVRVESDGMGVAAWLQTSGLDGEVPQGLLRIPGNSAKKEAVLVGVDPQSAKTLRIANSGTEPTGIRVTALGAGEPTQLGGFEDLEIEPMGVFDIDSSSLPAGTTALTVEADQPIVASLVQETEGAPFPADPKVNVALRSAVSQSEGFSSAVLPPSSEVESLGIELGFTNVAVSLTLANTSESAANVTVGEAQVELAPNTSQVLDMPTGAAATITSDIPIYGALSVSVESESGKVLTVLSLRQDVAGSVNRQVLVFPSNG